MLVLKNKNDCSGCHACYSACPQKCIEMCADSEGFLYPKINVVKCVNCGICEKICPILIVEQKSGILPTAFVSQNQNLEIRTQSSSGGVFSLLAEFIIQRGGIVFGATLDSNQRVRHVSVSSISQLSKLRGSKYVQSEIGNSYEETKTYLSHNKLVLFTGTPCQIAGLYRFLMKDYPNLYTQDVICHGVPSPMVWDKYVRFVEKKGNNNFKSMTFRDKSTGWKNYSINFDLDNNSCYKTNHHDDLYMRAFLKNITLRPSCYACHFKGVERKSDITLGDYWGVEKIHPEFDDDLGTSLVLCNSKKGSELFEKISDTMRVKKTDIDKALVGNSSALQSVKMPSVREGFFQDIKNKPIERCFVDYLDDNGKKAKRIQFKNDLKSIRNEKGFIFSILWGIKNFWK